MRRTLVILVDDLFMESAEFAVVRQALARFIDEEVRPDDRVSLIYTSLGSGALRQFTPEKPLLHRALEQAYWHPQPATAVQLGDIPLARQVNAILVQLGALPGRKSLVLIAPATHGARSLDARAVADLAGRASVVISAIDVRGGSQQFHSLDAVSLLAPATGGLFMHGPAAALDLLRDAADSAGYYLIGWHPGDGAFDDPRHDYHRVQIRARDKKLAVRTRDGFLAKTGNVRPAQPLIVADQVRRALTSPFHGGELEVKLTAGFIRQEAAGSYVDLQMHVTPKGVRFEQDAQGCGVARLEWVRALWPLDPGLPPSDRVNTQTFEINTCKTSDRVREAGFVATVRERVPAPGAYQLRVAVRNVTAHDVGSLARNHSHRVGRAVPGRARPENQSSGAVRYCSLDRQRALRTRR
jgi:hypothetical protein